jgi:hypothetical protein
VISVCRTGKIRLLPRFGYALLANVIGVFFIGHPE